MRQHELDPVSLVAGVVAAVIALFALVDSASWLDLDGRWLWPVVLIGLGVAGLVAAIRPDGPEPDGERSATSDPVER